MSFIQCSSMAKSAALDSMNERDQITVTRLRDTFLYLDKFATCDVVEYPTWFRLLWKVDTIKRATLVQLREMSPQITDVEIDFVEKRLLMHFTRHGVPVPKINPRKSKKRKRECKYTLETTESIVDKDRPLLDAIYGMVRTIVRCKPKYTVESKEKSYNLSFRIREKINAKTYERVWERYHAHLTSMTFDLEKSTLVLAVGKTS